VTVLAHATSASAQSEAALRSFFEGRRVTLKIAMPGTSDGVDIRPNTNRPFDRRQYENRLGQYGTALAAGDGPTVTLIKLKGDLIEFHLDGGGYGTIGDDTSTSVNLPLVEKSNYEKDLERRVKDETDPIKKRSLQHDLDDARDDRERENRRIRAEKSAVEERKRILLAERRLRGGSRFNIRYAGTVPPGISPEDVVTALGPYVDFSPPSESSWTTASQPGSGDATAVPRKGMSRDEMERIFGRPVSSAMRREGALTVTSFVFVRGEQRVTAEFVEDVLIRYAVTSR
jgi:hypothetical protein